MRKWGNFALVGSLEQSHLREIHVTWFFSSPKIRVMGDPLANVKGPGMYIVHTL